MRLVQMGERGEGGGGGSGLLCHLTFVSIFDQDDGKVPHNTYKAFELLVSIHVAWVMGWITPASSRAGLFPNLLSKRFSDSIRSWLWQRRNRGDTLQG